MPNEVENFTVQGQGKQQREKTGVAARRGQELLAPMLMKGSVNAIGFEQWLE